MSGLKARGGFVVSIEWKNGRASKIKIKSALGGNCRVRSYEKLAGDGFKITEAKGKNPNPFYEVPKIKQPLISPEAKIENLELKKSYLYDFQTKAGEEYILISHE